MWENRKIDGSKIEAEWCHWYDMKLLEHDDTRSVVMIRCVVAVTIEQSIRKYHTIDIQYKSQE